jgi:DNA-binding NarL/FixJ family response regulator
LDLAEMHAARGRRGDDRKTAAARERAMIILRSLGFEREDAATSSSREAGSEYALTRREAEILSLVSEGRRNNEIAALLTLSHRTVERHLENIFAKMDVSTRTEAVMKAAQAGMLS